MGCPHSASVTRRGHGDDNDDTEDDIVAYHVLDGLLLRNLFGHSLARNIK